MGSRGRLSGGGDPARATTLISESRRQGKRQSSGQLASSDAWAPRLGPPPDAPQESEESVSQSEKDTRAGGLGSVL